jgi:hypothetical protein
LALAPGEPPRGPEDGLPALGGIPDAAAARHALPDAEQDEPPARDVRAPRALQVQDAPREQDELPVRDELLQALDALPVQAGSPELRDSRLDHWRYGHRRAEAPDAPC